MPKRTCNSCKYGAPAPDILSLKDGYGKPMLMCINREKKEKEGKVLFVSRRTSACAKWEKR